MKKQLFAGLVLTLVSGAALAVDLPSDNAPTHMSAFDQLDVNKDGVLSRSEFDIHMQDMQRMQRGPMHRGDHMSGSAAGTSNVDADDAVCKKQADRLGIPEGSRACRHF